MGKNEKIKGYVARNPRMVKKFIRVYNRLCKPCGDMCRADSMTPMDKYCPECKNMMKEVMGI